jgi:hypothetical protein
LNRKRIASQLNVTEKEEEETNALLSYLFSSAVLIYCLHCIHRREQQQQNTALLRFKRQRQAHSNK